MSQCKDCYYIGRMVLCPECNNGYGWPCLVDKKRQHIHPDMQECVDFQPLKKFSPKDILELKNES